MSKQEDFGRNGKSLEKTREIDNEARISKKAQMKRKFNRNLKQIILWDIHLSSLTSLIQNTFCLWPRHLPCPSFHVSSYNLINALWPCLWHFLILLVFYAAQCLLLVYHQHHQKTHYRLIYLKHSPLVLLNVEITTKWRTILDIMVILITLLQSFFNEALALFWCLSLLLRRTQQNSQRWYFAWENLQEVFVMLVVVVVVFLTGGFYVSGLLFHATGTPPHLIRPVKASSGSDLYPGCFRLLYFCQAFSVTVLPRALRFWVGIFYPQTFFTLSFFTDIFRTVCESDVDRNPGSSSVPALTELSLPANTWTWTTHIVVSRPLTYQLRQWATKNRVKIELLNMFRLFKVICKNY